MENYTITYSNHFKIGNRTFAFRKKELFEIKKNIVLWVRTDKELDRRGCYIDRQWYSLFSLNEMAKGTATLTVDITNYAWYMQEELNHVFNLQNHVK